MNKVDLTLLHSPPCVEDADWVDDCMGNPAADLVYPHLCDCSDEEPCGMLQQQWLALEAVYKVRFLAIACPLHDRCMAVAWPSHGRYMAAT